MRERILCMLAVTTLCTACAAPEQHELLIRNATLYDGSGSPPIVGDLAIDGDRITAVGDVASRGPGWTGGL